MAYDDLLAARIRAALGNQPGLQEKKMFGGVGFLVNGNMCCGVHGDGMIVRLAPEQADQVLSQPHTQVFDMTGRPMKGWIVVRPQGLESDSELARWVEASVRYASSLPKK